MNARMAELDRALKKIKGAWDGSPCPGDVLFTAKEAAALIACVEALAWNLEFHKLSESWVHKEDCDWVFSGHIADCSCGLHAISILIGL